MILNKEKNVYSYGVLGAVKTDSRIPPDPREITLLMKTILEQVRKQNFLQKQTTGNVVSSVQVT